MSSPARAMTAAATAILPIATRRPPPPLPTARTVTRKRGHRRAATAALPGASALAASSVPRVATVLPYPRNLVEPLPCRFFASASSSSSHSGRRNNQYYKLRQPKKDPDGCPFATLGVPINAPYVAVRRAFLELALKHHPDTALAESDEELELHRDRFVKARRALERLAPGGGPDGTLAVLVEEAESLAKAANDADLDEWFKQETGYDMPFLDAATIREVAEMTETVGHGLDRDGGMWTLAQMVADSVKNGTGDGDPRSLLRLEAGDAKDRSQLDGILRRRRRW